jgi:hypothetical protein
VGQQVRCGGEAGMSTRWSEYARLAGDDYRTPGWVVRVVVPQLHHRDCRWIWACADHDDSELVRVFHEAGLGVTASAEDFLAKTALPDPKIDCIGTNPPFKLARQFIEHALTLAPVVAMLARQDYDCAKTREHLFACCESFAANITLIDRIVWVRRTDGIKEAPSDNHCWLIWDRRHQGPPTLSYARRDEIRRAQFGDAAA